MSEARYWTAGVCGKTGSGKSTLMNVLFSLGPLTSGTAKVAGQDLAPLNVRQVRNGVAVVPRRPGLTPSPLNTKRVLEYLSRYGIR